MGYTPRLIVNPDWDPSIDVKICEEIHKANEFEFYYGIKENPERLQEMSINRALFYSIYEKESNNLVGYLGFTEKGEVWEPEIYIFSSYRGKGYGAEALKVIITGLFTGLLLVEREGKMEKVVTEQIVSTVREENIASQRMMEKIGFKRNEDVACCFIGYINSDEEEDNSFIKVEEYSLTKKSFFHMY